MTGGNFFFNLLQKSLLLKLKSRRQILFSGSGAPAHYYCDVRLYFNKNLLDRWIGQKGLVEYPFRSASKLLLKEHLNRPRPENRSH